MYPTNTYVIRQATVDDERTVRGLAELDGRRALTGPVLIGEIDGTPAAAMSLADGQTAADPFQPTAQLVGLLGIRARALRALEAEPSLPARLRASMSGWKARNRGPAAA